MNCFNSVSVLSWIAWMLLIQHLSQYLKKTFLFFSHWLLPNLQLLLLWLLIWGINHPLILLWGLLRWLWFLDLCILCWYLLILLILFYLKLLSLGLRYLLVLNNPSSDMIHKTHGQIKFFPLFIWEIAQRFNVI